MWDIKRGFYSVGWRVFFQSVDLKGFHWVVELVVGLVDKLAKMMVERMDLKVAMSVVR